MNQLLKEDFERAAQLPEEEQAKFARPESDILLTASRTRRWLTTM